MPHALTPRQREYLEFIREYVKVNESSPGLDEIAKHFNVTSPTAHKALRALESKGFLYFGRDSVAGFFIRLVERAGTSEIMIDVPISGKVNQYGELYEFPDYHGRMTTLLMGAERENIIALKIAHVIPQANMLPNDILICDTMKRPQPGDIAIFPFDQKAKRLFLSKVYSLTHDKDTASFEVSNPYPIPEDLINKEYGQRLNWAPLTYDKTTEEYFDNLGDEIGIPARAYPPEYAIATALRLSRRLAY